MDEAKMAALDAVVSKVDAQGGPTPEQAAEQEQADKLITEAQEWGSIAFMIGGALSMIAPELRKVYTEQACMAWGETVVPVSQKYGWGGPGSIPEIGLAISTLALGFPTYKLVRMKLDELAAAKKAEEGAAPAAPGPLDDVGIAPVVPYGG